MAKEEKGAGFQQAAGLIRYFDAEEETSIKFDPRIIMAVTLAFSVFILLLEHIPQTKLGT